MIDLRKTAAVRLRRSAHLLPRGEEILETLVSMEDQIVAAAEKGIPPVSAISGTLQERFGKHLKAIIVRQFIGTAVKAILADRGFEVAQTGIRLPKDPVFSTGAAYRRVEATEEDGPLSRAFANMVRGMSQQERQILLDALLRARGGD